MKRLLLLLGCLLALNLFSQNIHDAYKYHVYPEIVALWSNDDKITDFTGEYQIFLDKLYWAVQDEYEDAAISFSMEAVSFPFIPEDFSPDYPNILNVAGQTRVLNTAPASSTYDYGVIESLEGINDADGYKGWGWQYGDYKIYQKVYNENICDKDDMYVKCNGDYGLISEAYKDDPYGDAQCLIPHTVMRHTVYFHCGDSITDPVIDSLSWLYDNTRGIMRKYPFHEPIQDKSQETLLINHILDVAFRPTFHDYPIANSIPYYPPFTSNGVAADYYYSGFTPSGGSVDYFPPSEVYDNWNICGSYPLYFKETNPQTGSLISYHNSNDFESSFVHPPPYALLDAPLLNCRVVEYAGYKESHDTLDEGIYHTYRIDQAFNLRIINPKEKIIYNPSHVIIDCNLTFPCNYQFITLRGKYADKYHEVEDPSLPYGKEYWDAISDFDFEYDKDYPIPVNCSTNAECKSNYILEGGASIYFQPPIIIMDAHFEGTSLSNKETIYLDPSRTYGNWTYDTLTIELSSDLSRLPACIENDPNIESGGNKSTHGSNSIPNEKKTHLIILNGSTKHPHIKVNVEQYTSTKLTIYSSFGVTLHSEIISNNNQTIDCSDLPSGVHHAILTQNGQVIDRISFGKR